LRQFTRIGLKNRYPASRHAPSREANEVTTFNEVIAVIEVKLHHIAPSQVMSFVSLAEQGNAQPFIDLRLRSGRHTQSAGRGRLNRVLMLAFRFSPAGDGTWTIRRCQAHQLDSPDVGDPQQIASFTSSDTM
jgi:hypothetical protein